jgi:RNA polymerase sigma-70 factor (ECF subfamily)
MDCPSNVWDQTTKEWPVDVADLAKLAQMFEEHQPKLLTMIQRRSDRGLSARRDPEDILSDAYVKAQARWKDFPQSGMTPYAWLYRIALDCLLDDHDFQTRQRRSPRAETHWPDRSSRQIVLGLVSRLTSPSEALARKEAAERLREQVDETLALLKTEDRDVLTMRFVDQLSTEEVAHVLGLEEATARQRYSRARLRFRAAWKKHFGNDGVPRE